MARAAYQAENAGLTPFRIGIVGLGRAGFSHWAQSQFEEGMNVVAVCRRDGRAAEDQAALLGDVSIFTDFREMFAAVPMDGVIVATPPAAAPHVATVAIDAGVRAIFVEKPGGEFAAQLRGLASRAAERGAIGFVAYPRRARSDFRAVRDHLVSRAADARFDITIEWSEDFERWFDGHLTPETGFRGLPTPARRGALLESGSHAIDALMWLFGPIGEVTEVRLERGKRGLDIAGRIAMRFSRGHRAVLSLSMSSGEPRHRVFTATGSTCSIRIDDNGSTIEDVRTSSVLKADRPEPEQWSMFAKALSGRRSRHICSFDDAGDVLAVIDAAYDRAAEGGQ